MNTKLILQKETMTSIEIAEFFDKRHNNVLRDIEDNLTIIGVNHLTFEGVYIGGNGEFFRYK